MSEMTDQERRKREERIRSQELMRRKEQILSFQTIATGWQAVEECQDEDDGRRSFVLSPVIGFVLVACPGHRDNHGEYTNYEVRPVTSCEIGQEISQCPVIPPGFDDKNIPMYLDQMCALPGCVRYFVKDGDNWRMVDHFPDEPKPEE